MKHLKNLIKWIIYLFITEYKITVSYNDKYGDSDDREFIARKVLKSSDKLLKFIDNKGKNVEIRSTEGLHFRIEEL